MSFSAILEEVSQYYGKKLELFGPEPRGVDWNNQESQELRFDQLLKVLSVDTASFSLLDYGCGYGALHAHLQNKGFKVSYTGFDINPSMVETARSLSVDKSHWVNDPNELYRHDYVLASGVFNVKQDRTNAEWASYVHHVLDQFHDLSEKGFAFNMLTAYADPEYQQTRLYYADPAAIFVHCKQHFSPRVALLHDYPLYEFTFLVKKQV